MKDLTQAQLKELLHYEPETGLWTRLVAKTGKVRNRKTTKGVTNYAGYLTLGVDYKVYKAHRLAFLWMTGEWPTEQVDHINGVRDDNRWCNLREVTQQENQRNAKRSVKNTSGVTGVYLDGSVWLAHIKVNNKSINLGRFKGFDEAVSARKEAELEHGFHTNHGRG